MGTHPELESQSQTRPADERPSGNCCRKTLIPTGVSAEAMHCPCLWFLRVGTYRKIDKEALLLHKATRRHPAVCRPLGLLAITRRTDRVGHNTHRRSQRTGAATQRPNAGDTPTRTYRAMAG